MSALNKHEQTQKIFWEKQLFSPDEAVVLKTIADIEKSGKTWILPALFQVFASSQSPEISTAVFNLLINLKDSSAIPYIVAAIQAGELKNIRGKLISTCWQSRLDFGAHAELFADFFIHEDFGVAFEAFTVLENLDSIGNKTMVLNKLRNPAEIMSEEKEFLRVELIDMLSAR